MSEPAPTRPARTGWSFAGLSAEAREYGWMPHALLLLVAGFFVIATLWAAFAEIDQVVRGDGKVITRSQIQLVQNLEGGILSEILVREGDTVEKDQPLMRIDSTRYVSAFRESEQGSLSLQAKIARLAAETSGARLEFPAAVQKGAAAVAANERALHETRRRDQATKDEILRQQLAQRQGELVELRTREQRLRESMVLITKELEITAPLVKQGVISEIELLRQEREATRIRTDLDAATQAIPRVQSSIEEARRKLEDNQLSFRSQAGVELSQARAEYAKLAETLPALEDRVARALVRAPAKGTVKTIFNKTVGGVVQPGSPMAELVPLEDTLLVETRISPGDIAFVQAGQRALVKIASYDYSIYGGLDGNIEYVSADSIQPQQPQQGEPYYIAHVRTTAATLRFRDRDLPVIPGMTASVDVITNRHTVLHYLLKPVNRAMERALRER